MGWQRGFRCSFLNLRRNPKYSSYQTTDSTINHALLLSIPVIALVHSGSDRLILMRSAGELGLRRSCGTLVALGGRSSVG